jgi:arginyl-tRNA synthetase
MLQRGDEETLRLWRILVDESLSYFDEVYKRLGVLLTRDDVVGESFYNPMLPAVVADLDAAGLLVEDDGAMCVFPPGFTNREGEPLPLIVQKQDEGFGYAATDLAAIRDRVDRLHAGRICYVVGAPQAQHLQMCFTVAQMAGWLPEEVRAEHVAFGSVLGADRKVLRTRSGETVRLVDLLDEADTRAAEAVAERWPEMDPAERATLAPLIANAALKYADLSNDRRKDYVFDLERMVQFEGDTGPYLQYAHARCRSIIRRAEPADHDAPALPLIGTPEERALALALLGVDEAVNETAAQAAPNRLCLYLFELAGAFTAFYDACPVLQAPDAALRRSRLFLCELVARTLALGLDLLGIVAPERM